MGGQGGREGGGRKKNKNKRKEQKRGETKWREKENEIKKKLVIYYFKKWIKKKQGETIKENEGIGKQFKKGDKKQWWEQMV